MPPATLSPEWSYKLQPSYQRQKGLPSSFPFTPTSLSHVRLPSSLLLSVTLMSVECDQKRTLSFSFSLGLRCPKRLDRQRFLHRLDINERTSRTYRKDVRSEAASAADYSRKYVLPKKCAPPLCILVQLTQIDFYTFLLTNIIVTKHIFHRS